MNKHLQYAWYVIRHKAFVAAECWRLGIPIQGLLHDLSKMLPDEWFAYVESFYGYHARNKLERPEYVKDAFNLAWLLHQHRNPHHWQFWRLRMDDGSTKLIPMPENYVREMLADWRGAGRAITGSSNIGEWYRKNYSNIELADETRERLHELMEYNELPFSVRMMMPVKWKKVCDGE